MQRVQAYIGIRGAVNSSQFSDVPIEQMDLYQKLWWHPVHSQVRVPKTRWVVLRYPTPSMAQAANMSTAAFEDFYFDVCTVDYAQMARDQEPLVQRMLAADRVKITAPGTDLEFSIRGIPVRPCHGQRNIPDGECFTAPLRDSINGVIRYNTPSLYQGTIFERIEFEFRQGKIVRATCSNEPEKLNRILDSDEGARYIGEWSHRLQQPHPPADARHAVRREDRRVVPPHAGQRLRRMRQRQPQPRALGPGADPDARVRRRRDLFRRRAAAQGRPLRARRFAGAERGTVVLMTG